MQSTIIDSNELFQSSRWDANFFFKSSESLNTNYEMVKLSDLLVERKGFLEPQNFPQHLFNYVGLENISQKTRLLVDFKPKLGLEIKSRSKIFRNGDILYGRMRPTLNKVLRVNIEITEGICSNEIFVLSPNIDDVNPVYLEEILGSRWVQSEVERIVGGATMPRINIKDFMAIRIPLPPMEKQIEIADFIKSERDSWVKNLRLVERTPSLILQTVMDSLQGNVDYRLNASKDKSDVWDNPLPDLELAKKYF